MDDSHPIVIGNLSFDPSSGELSGRAGSRRLEPKAAAVLAALCSARGSVVSRPELLDLCWGNGGGSDEALTQSVAQIRRAAQELGEDSGTVETLAKRGYRLRAQVGSGPGKPPATPTPTAVSRRSYSRPALAAAGVAILLLMAAWVMFPHGPRHFVRHALGFGPTSQSPNH